MHSLNFSVLAPTDSKSVSPDSKVEFGRSTSDENDLTTIQGQPKSVSFIDTNKECI